MTEGIHDRFVEAMTDAVANLTVGDALDSSTISDAILAVDFFFFGELVLKLEVLFVVIHGIEFKGSIRSVVFCKQQY